MKNKKIFLRIIIALITFSIISTSLLSCGKAGEDIEEKPLVDAFSYPSDSPQSGENGFYVFHTFPEYEPKGVPKVKYSCVNDEEAVAEVEIIQNRCFRDIGVEFAEGDEFTVEYNGVRRTRQFHLTDGDLCCFDDEFGGYTVHFEIFKNGDLRFLEVKKFPADRTRSTLSNEEVDEKAKEILEFYNKNLITGEKIVDFEKYERVIDGHYGDYVLRTKKNGWWIYKTISVNMWYNNIPIMVDFGWPGQYDNEDVPAAIEPELLKEKVLNMLKPYGIPREGEDISITDSKGGYLSGAVNIRRLTDGTPGLEIAMDIIKDGEWNGKIMWIFVPFDSLGLE